MYRRLAVDGSRRHQCWYVCSVFIYIVTGWGGGAQVVINNNILYSSQWEIKAVVRS